MKILIAEDEPEISLQYKLALEDKGHEVRITDNGEDCLKLYKIALRHEKIMGTYTNSSTTIPFKDIEIPFDAVILDYRMPKKDGLEVAKQILDLCPHQRIIFASAYVVETLVESLRNLHQITELLQKPFDIDYLVDTVEDKGVYEQLGELNVRVKELRNFDPTHEQLVGMLAGVKKLQNELLHSRS